MLTEQTGYKLDVLPDGRMKVHKITHIFKDGKQIAEVFGEYGDYVPGQFDDPKAMADAPIKAMAAAIWTPEVKAAYAAKMK
ncbi:MAG: hypothetical protein WC455_17565 [Dehalococcoidia bacterium]|jgi:hypothetical protein